MYRCTQTGQHYDCTAVQLIQAKCLIHKPQYKFEWAKQSVCTRDNKNKYTKQYINTKVLSIASALKKQESRSFRKRRASRTKPPTTKSVRITLIHNLKIFVRHQKKYFVFKCPWCHSTAVQSTIYLMYANSKAWKAILLFVYSTI
jgi:hypothetical protein